MGSIVDTQVQKLLESLSKDEQNFAKAVATMKVENKVLHRQLADLKAQHDDLWKILVVLLHRGKDAGIDEVRIHRSQFLRFKEEYRIDKQVDEEHDEVVVRLLTLRD
jgi:hypothetical protein